MAKVFLCSLLCMQVLRSVRVSMFHNHFMHDTDPV